jgi:hypothetical protein
MRNILNTTLANETRHDPSVHERPAHEQQRLPAVRRVGLVDRAALHLGVALIKWGRRPGVAPRHERRATRLERALLSNEIDTRVDSERQKAVLEYAQMLRMR